MMVNPTNNAIIIEGARAERAEYTPVGEVAATQLGEAGQVASVNQEAHLIKGG
jgi:hypothetical protein